MKMVALDIETASPSLLNRDLALDPKRNIITKVALYGDTVKQVTDTIPIFSPNHYVTHGGKFDFKSLIFKGANLSPAMFSHDTLSMSVVFPYKIEESWLANYEKERVKLNKEAGKNIHRNAGPHSLKTLAPYFLGVEPFWETEDHANDEYALKDAQYTYQLSQFFLSEFTNEQRTFYMELQEWNRMLLRAELRGCSLDFVKMKEYEDYYRQESREYEERLANEWKEHFDIYLEGEKQALELEYREKTEKAIAKLKDKTKEESTKQRYLALLQKAESKVKPLNLSSPVQLKWLLKERLGCDVLTFKGDEESTGIAVLERLAGEGVKGVDTFIKWRKANKLVTAFFPSYLAEAYDKRIFTNYRLEGTRTGRLSSSSVNLQQIPKAIMDIFCAPPGRKLIYRDVSAIEPRLIAFETEDPALCKIFIDGSDFHSFNVRTTLNIEEEDSVIKSEYGAERDLMKEVGLALMYGAGWRRIQECAAKRGFKWTEKFCKQLYRRFAQTYERVWEYKEALEKSINAGEIVTNIMGRPLHYDLDRLHMQSLNTKIQSGGSDILLASVCRAEAQAIEKNIVFEPVLFIHDSITVETLDKDAEKVYSLIGEVIGSFQLSTIYGDIPLKSEGGIYQNLPAKK